MRSYGEGHAKCTVCRASEGEMIVRLVGSYQANFQYNLAGTETEPSNAKHVYGGAL